MKIHTCRHQRPLICVGITLLTACSGDPAPDDERAPLAPLSVFTKHPIDGVADFSAFANVNQVVLEFVDGIGSGTASGKLTTVRWVTDHDDRELYVALEWNDDTYNHSFDATIGPIDFDGIKLQIDGDGSGLYSAGDDARTVIAASVRSHYIDQHEAGGEQPDQVEDGQGWLRYDPLGMKYTAEFRLPMMEDTNDEDADVLEAARFNFVLFDHVELGAGTGGVAGHHGLGSGGSDTSGWTELGIEDTVPHQHADPPEGLGGLIVFLSAHENPLGDIYAFDPAQQVTTRVTNLPGLFKDGISLSHDRTRIAFYGASSAANISDYEIYVVNIDGTGFAALTNNSILDGHPAWSNDDSRIVYASLRDAEFSLILMEANGTELADLTPMGADDNDPEYLPDGRITFKTARFSVSPEVRIAVMDEDGTNVQQLSFVDSVSDHDPVGDGSVAIFERFTQPTNYTTDPDALFHPWDLVEVQLDGSAERTLSNDGWVNWLPVYDPSGQYIAYLKTQGYTAIHLMTRDGQELGRLVPDFTSVGYIDWK